MSLYPSSAPYLESGHQLITSPAILRWGQHVVTAILLAVVVLRGLSTEASLWPVLLAATLFAGWYVAGFVRMAMRGEAKLPSWWIAVLLAIWVGSLWTTPEFMWLAFSLWLLLGHQLPLLPSILWSLVLYAFTIMTPYLHNGQSSLASVVGPLVGGLFAWGISRGYLQLERDAEIRSKLVDSLMRAQQEMADLQEELARSQHEAGIAAERTRLAREIHDTVAQQLSSIGLHAKAATAAADPQTALDTLARIDELSGQSLNDLRRIIAALAPAELDAQALAGALERVLASFETDSKVATRLNIEEGIPALDPGIQIALLRTAQSALSNVRRHAQATRVSLNLGVLANEVRMDIVDDGIGFDVESPRHGATPAGGFGLTAMTQRLGELGGGLDIESSPGEGTALCAHLPMTPRKDAQ